MGFFRDFWKKDDSTTGYAYHSGAYHSFFDGYTERKVTDPKTGKTKIKRVYSAEYIRRKGSDQSWICDKILTAGFYLLALILHLYATTLLSANSSSKYMELLPAAGLLVYFVLLYILIKFLSVPRKMKTGEYKSYMPGLYKGFKIAATIAFLSAVLAAVLFFIYLGTEAEAYWGLALSAALFAVSGGGLLFMDLRGERTEYEWLDNQAADDSGIMIHD